MIEAEQDKNHFREQKVKQFRKGALELAILKIISDDEMYGYNIVQTLKKHNLAISEGTVYPILSRLKEEGAVTYRWDESESGPPRKYYSLTGKGRELFGVLLCEWENISSSISSILRR